MILESGIKVYNTLLKKCVEYVNKGWGTAYGVEDVVGIEFGTTFLFVHFNKEDYSKEACPITISLKFEHTDY